MITIGCKSLAPLCKDYEFVVNDKNQLAKLIAKLVMGWSYHVSRLIKNLDPHYPDVDKATIQSQLDKLNGGDSTLPSKRSLDQKEIVARAYENNVMEKKRKEEGVWQFVSYFLWSRRK